MLDPGLFLMFLAAALLLAISPGPGMFYVLTRTLSGGGREGVSSSFGTLIGGLVHVVAAAFGISAILVASATAFTIVKCAGAIYLVWLGLKMIRTRHANLDASQPSVSSIYAFRQGVVTELLNPKTALFFLSFLPQFVNPRLGNPLFQLLTLGVVSVVLNTTVDLLVVFFAAPFGRCLRTNIRFRRNQRVAAGLSMIGLGTFVAFGERR